MLPTQRGYAQAAGGSQVALVSPRLKLGTQSLTLPVLSPSQLSLSCLSSYQALSISYLWRCQRAGLPPRELTASERNPLPYRTRLGLFLGLSRLSPRGPPGSEPGLTPSQAVPSAVCGLIQGLTTQDGLSATMGPEKGEIGPRLGGEGASRPVHPIP